MRRLDLVAVTLSCSSALALAACASAAPGTSDADAPASLVPRSVAGAFSVTSEVDMPMPAEAASALAPLVAATDGPDDPSRYLLDRLVDQLPAGTIQTVARDAVPLLASYLNTRLADVAPHLTSGLHALALGLERIARHVGTLETWQVDRICHGQEVVLVRSPAPGRVRLYDAAGRFLGIGESDGRGLVRPRRLFQAD